MNIPNSLSILRILLIPLAIFALFNFSTGAFLIIFFIAGISDFFDGWLARKLKQVTDLGAMLDVAADRLLILSVFIALAIKFDLEPILIGLILFRDVIVVFGRIMLSKKYGFLKAIKLVKPTFLGKLTTTIQLITVGAIVFNIFHVFLIQISICLSVITGLHYLYSGLFTIFKKPNKTYD